MRLNVLVRVCRTRGPILYWNTPSLQLIIVLVFRQIDNHVDGHSLPVLFCFREGGALVSANGKSGSGGDVTGDCRLTVSLVGW